MYYELIYFDAAIDREQLEVLLLARSSIEFEHKGVHHKKRVYLVESRLKSDTQNAVRFARMCNFWISEIEFGMSKFQWTESGE